MKHHRIIARGKVQGVWYRASTRNKAEELGIKGFVRNEADGSVYIEAEGDEAALQALASWCREGPEHARVESVEVQEGPFKGFESFEVRR